MNILFKSLADFHHKALQLTPQLTAAFLVFLAFIVLGRLASKATQNLLAKGLFSSFQTALITKLVSSAFWVIGFTLAMNILGLEKILISFIAGGGLVAVIFGFAFKEIGENLLAGIFLSFSRPFKIGDLIESEGLAGTVQDIEMRYTHIRTEDGRDIYIPNSQIFNRPLINYTKDGLRRFSFTVGIDYADQTDRACSVLLNAVKNEPGVLSDPGPGATVSAMQPQYVEILVVYWVDMFAKDGKNLNVRSRIIEACRKGLLESRFTLSADCVTNIALNSNEKKI